MKKYVVPEGMLAAAVASFMTAWERRSNGYRTSVIGKIIAKDCRTDYSQALEAAIRWLAENPIVPTDEQVRLLFEAHQYGVSREAWRKYFTEWQSIMFLAPEPEVPEAIEDILLGPSHQAGSVSKNTFNEMVRLAYERGLKAGSK